jgi:type II secretion system protein C
MGAWLIMALNGALLGLCCFVVASVVTEIGSEALEPVRTATMGPTPDNTDARPAPPALILERNLFGAQLDGDNRQDAVEADVKLSATKLPLKLLGTAAANVEERSRAAIQDTKTRKHMVVAVGDRLVGHHRVRVTRIERTRIVLDNAGRPEELLLNENDPLPRARKRRNRNASRVKRDRRANQKPTLNQRLEELGGEDGIAKILSSARITPDYVDGKMRGMKVDAIKAESIFERIGFQNGDVITEVNGIVIDRISATNAIFEELSSADAIETAVLRGGEALTLSASAEQLMEQR